MANSTQQGQGVPYLNLRSTRQKTEEKVDDQQHINDLVRQNFFSILQQGITKALQFLGFGTPWVSFSPGNPVLGTTKVFAQGGNFIGTTDGIGSLTIPFPNAYGGGMLTVLLTLGSAAFPDVTLSVLSYFGNAGIVVVAYNPSGSPVVGALLSVNWLVIGY